MKKIFSHFTLSLPSLVHGWPINQTNRLEKRIKTGFTLPEILIVLAIIGILAVIGLGSLANQSGKARDAKRKSDLNEIKTALEQYAYDKGTYPATSLLTTCGSQALSPYLLSIPCDPSTKTAYLYQPLGAGATAGKTGYRILAILEWPNDPSVAKLGCFPTCGRGGLYNYGVASGTDVCLKDPNNNCPNVTGF